MAKCIFYDPVLAETYTWPVNYLEQDGPDRARNVTYEGNASALGLMPTQGDASALELNLTGKIIHRAQHIKFLEYFEKSNSFRYTDEEGFQYEVSMISYLPKKKRCSFNNADSSMRLHTYDYTMKLLVLRIISGDYSGVIEIPS